MIESNIYFKNILKYNLFFQKSSMEKSIFSKRKKYLKNTKNIDHSSFPRIEKSLQKYFPNTRKGNHKKTLRIETGENILKRHLSLPFERDFKTDLRELAGQPVEP